MVLKPMRWVHRPGFRCGQSQAASGRAPTRGGAQIWHHVCSVCAPQSDSITWPLSPAWRRTSPICALGPRTNAHPDAPPAGYKAQGRLPPHPLPTQALTAAPHSHPRRQTTAPGSGAQTGVRPPRAARALLGAGSRPTAAVSNRRVLPRKQADAPISFGLVINTLR